MPSPSINALPFNVRAYPYLAKGNGTDDDTAAIQAAIDACAAAGGGVVYFPAGDYLIAGPATTRTGVAYFAGHPATCKAQLWIPDIQIQTMAGRTIVLEGPTMGHMTPSLIGTCLPIIGGARLISNCATAGAAVIGGISADSTYPWTDATLVILKMGLRLPPNPVIHGVNASYICAFKYEGFTVDTGQWAIGLITEPTNYSVGIITPKNSNGAFTVGRDSYVLGTQVAYQINEHTNMDACCAFGVYVALDFLSAGHGSHIGRFVTQQQKTVIRGTLSTGGDDPGGLLTHRFTAGHIGIERKDAGHWYSSTNDVVDPDNILMGSATFVPSRSGGNDNKEFVISGAAKLECRLLWHDQLEIRGTVGGGA